MDSLKKMSINKTSFLAVMALTGLFMPLFIMGQELFEIADSKKRIAIEGVSVLPPAGKGWTYQKSDAAHLEIGRVGEKFEQSLVGAIALLKSPVFTTKDEFLIHIKNERERIMANNRYKMIFHREWLTDDKDTWCVRYHTQYRDYGANNKPKEIPFLIIEDMGIICLHPQNKNIAVNIGFSQRSKAGKGFADFTRLANDFIAIAKLEPFSKSKTELGFSAFKNRQYEQAINFLSEAIAEDPTDSMAYFYRGFCYCDQEKLGQAESDWCKTISLNTDLLEAYINLGALYFKNKQYDKAVHHADECIKLMGSIRLDEQKKRGLLNAYRLRGDIHFQCKRYPQAIKDYRFLLKCDNQTWTSYDKLVQMIIRNGGQINRKECISLLQEAEKRVPKEWRASVYRTYGELYNKLGEKDNAAAAYKKAFQ